MKIVHISHVDLDGAGCVVLAKHVFASEDYSFYTAGYGDFLDKVFRKQIKACTEPIDLLLFTDICPTAAQIEYLNTSGILYQIIDHHDTAKEFHNGNNILIHESTTCGTLGTYMWLTKMFNAVFPPELERLTYLVNIWDTYQEEASDFEEAKDLAMYVGFLGLETYVQDTTIHLFTLNALRRKRDAVCKKYAYFSENIQIGDVTIGIAVTSDYISDVAHALLKHGCQYALIVNPASKAISLRAGAKSPLHIGKIAETLAQKHEEFVSGGGHEKAAGVTYSYFLDLNTVVLQVIDEFKIRLQ